MWKWGFINISSLKFYLVFGTYLFSSPDLKGQVSFSHHLSSVVVVIHCSGLLTFTKIFFSETDGPNQILPNLATIITRVSCLKNVSDDPACQPTWPTWLKIEHRGKIQFLAFISETKAFRANLMWGKYVYQVNIYPLVIFRQIRQPIVVCCPWIGSFKEILQFLVIILNIIINRDKLSTAIYISNTINYHSNLILHDFQSISTYKWGTQALESLYFKQVSEKLFSLL